MYRLDDIADRLHSILEALERIPRRFQRINRPEDFLSSDQGRDYLDAICMVLLAVGEEFRQIDQKTEGVLLTEYPKIAWKKVIGLRNILAHAYSDVDENQIYGICKNEIVPLIETTKQMIKDMEGRAT